ncbi:YeeE/YedE family protein [Thalassomonas sp. M1454]|uniref:YeeE/YedE family protein n=1 Tax=Thalassomonas sp. M1454 TaxID=2594477 RepID=UPI00118019AB|nr:YeeE/YedE family protein [Thalassomonas sp. M1454]TRX56461.1 YeeE/YedE family protein [Thalassomonas sp. M1454]
MNNIIALVCGVLFGAGLTVAQMVSPNKVLNFLDLAGTWDASLAFVMGGALVIYIITYQLIIKKMKAPVCAQEFALPEQKNVDKRLITGSALFGIGWGISGICPGPAIANLSSGNVKVIVFILAMTLGIFVAQKLANKV